ncbi:DUF1992 domain-containing protein [Actinomadura sp. KC216]|uniref:DnaJ family domain-containing protein n=1 Tax=Actinomadura sp. KC216 TaxID=2530370 RepID=UPI00104A6188|nr:DUF1992 domain-containing protein [Actinomadura sp. KC216]TDB83521.1 DUF1992 domain-containing protein [Actinomadura sp. KC216]
MTERKPAGLSFESWIDGQIREAEGRGEFDGLPGAGKPLPDAGRPLDDNWWIKQKLASEGLVAMIHPTLSLRREIEDVMEAALKAPSERSVRRMLEPVNEKIAANLRFPPPGPALGYRPIDIDEVVARWREAHSARVERSQRVVGESRDKASGRRWRLFFRRRRRG